VLQERIIIGIDPGTLTMGYGVIQAIGNKIHALQYGILQLHQYASQALKLQKIFQHTLQILEEFHPDEVALEAPFYGKNVQSMLKLGRAQGVAMAAALVCEIPITEYAPRKVKQAITGNGNASKEQVAYMLTSLLQLQDKPTQLDATDALAVAVCHAYQRQYPSQRITNWKRFIQENPDLVL
jgi:crossover junction endodeoxyribonuclease RuvC